MKLCEKCFKLAPTQGRKRRANTIHVASLIQLLATSCGTLNPKLLYKGWESRVGVERSEPRRDELSTSGLCRFPQGLGFSVQ